MLNNVILIMAIKENIDTNPKIIYNQLIAGNNNINKHLMVLIVAGSR